MVQQGQVLQMTSRAADGSALWSYRYRVGGRDSRRVQRGGFASERDAGEALERALERLRRANGTAQLAEVASRLGQRSGALVMFAAATGLRPGEWIALEQRDIDREARVVYVRRAFRNGRLKCTKTEGSVRAVPLQAIALEQIPAGAETNVLFP